MVVQNSRNTAEKTLGSLLFCCITDVAFLEIEDIDPEKELAKVGGEQPIYDRLSARYPPKEAQDKVVEALDGVFTLRVEKRVRTDVYAGRARKTFNRARREGIVLPDEARGYLLM